MLSSVVFAARYVFGLLRRDDRGVTAVEYGLILALIAGVIITGLLLLGPALSSLFSNSANCLSSQNATGCAGP
jgi:pilus assembly protein Flp/PilA